METSKNWRKSKTWHMPPWMVKYKHLIGKDGNLLSIEESINSIISMNETEFTMKAKVDLLQHLHDKGII